MIELTIRTVSQDYKFRVPSTLTVLELKQYIAKQVNVAVIQQRFIYYGHDLSDETKLDDIDIDGKVLHLVQKVPCLATTSETTPTTTNTNNTSVQNGRRRLRRRHGYDPNTITNTIALVIGIPPEYLHIREISREEFLQNTGVRRNNRTVNCVTVGLDMIRRSNLVLNRLDDIQIVDDELSEESSQQPEESSTTENRSTAFTNDRRGFRELINQLNKLNARLQPFYSVYWQYINEHIQSESSTIGVEGENGSQRKQAIFNGVSEVLHYMSHIYNIIADLSVRFDRSPPRSIQCCTSAAQQATYTQITTANRSIPNVWAFRPGFMNREEAENETFNLSTSTTSNDSNTENNNAATEILPETPHGVELISNLTSGTSDIISIDSIEGALVPPNYLGSSQPIGVFQPSRDSETFNNMSMPIDRMDQTISSGGQLSPQRVIYAPILDTGLSGIYEYPNDAQATSQSISLTDSLARQIRVGVDSVSPSIFVLWSEPNGDSERQTTAPSPEQLLFIPIGNIPYFRDLEGQFLLVDLFLLLARNWTFHDILSLNFNNRQSSIVQNPVFRKAKNIASFFLEKVMLNQPPTNQNIEEAANRIFLKMVPYLNVLVCKRCPESTSEKQNILSSFLRCIIHNLRQIVVFCDENRIFASNEIVTKLTVFAKEFLALVVFWCKRQNEFELTIHALLELLSLPTMLLDTVVFTFFMNVHQYWESFATFQILNLPKVHYYVSSNEPIVGQTSSVRNENPIYYSTRPSSGVINESLPEVLIGSQESTIHHDTSSEMVPAITRDSQRQGHQETLPLYSNAYLSGMPITQEDSDKP